MAKGRETITQYTYSQSRFPISLFHESASFTIFPMRTKIFVLITAALLPFLAFAETAPVKEAPKPDVLVPNPYKLDISAHKGKSKSRTSERGRLETYEFTIGVANLDAVRGWRGFTAEFYALGQDRSDHNLFGVVSSKTATFDLPRRGKHEFKSDFFKIKYTSGTGSTLGGYLVLIYDKEGRLVKIKSTRTSFEKNIQKIREARVSTTGSQAFRM